MTNLPDQLAKLLNAAQIPGDFYATGVSAAPLLRITVDGVGPVALPLLPFQAQQLIAVAHRAPYGKGEETLVDTNVRRTWQIAADQVHITGQHWATRLQAIVAQVAAGLGVTGSVVPEFYKLLVYDTGSFFVSHRDTEKTPGMFATLVIALPSDSEGGELVVQHQGKSVRLDLRCADPSELAFAAFYADCPHEVRPVTSGNRLVLVYNLLRQGPGKPPQPPHYQAETQATTALLQQWSAAKGLADDATPEKLVYLLAHAYTPAELCFKTLKGADAAAAGVLLEAAPPAGCDLHVALLTVQESGSAEHTGYSSSRRGRWGGRGDDGAEEFEIGEIFDRSLTLSQWLRPDGSPAGLGDFPFRDDEVCPADGLQDLEPDEQYFQEATGNEGASFDRTYQRAALVLWPQHRALAVLNQGGLSKTLPWLAALAARWTESGAGQDSPLWNEANVLAGHMLRTWPRATGYHLLPDQPSETGQMLALLAALNDVAHLEALVLRAVAAGSHPKGDNPALLKALARLPVQRAGELLERVVVANAAAGMAACVDLLSQAAAAAHGRASPGAGPGASPGAGPGTEHLVAAASALVHALPGDPEQAKPIAYSQRPAAMDGPFVSELMMALWRIDTGLADNAAAHLLAWPATYGLDAAVVPALRLLAQQADVRQSACFARLRAAGLAHLQARASLPLAPPGDWSRRATLHCRCQHCSGLAQFLASPTAQTWRFKATEFDRSHVVRSIRGAVLDVDCATDKGNRPYSLVCTKNQASYARLAAQRQRDLADLAVLAPGASDGATAG